MKTNSLSRLLLVFLLVFWAALAAHGQCQPLAAGTYTVGGVSASFPTLDSVLNRLRCAGVSGPVTLQLAAGNYTGRFVLDSLPGMPHRIRIQSNGGAVFSRGPSVLAPESFVLSGGRWELVQLAFERSVQLLNNGPMVRIEGGKQHRLSNNRFTDRSFGPYPGTTAILYRGGDSLRVDSNAFSGWDRAFYADSVSQAQALLLEHNLVESYSNTAFGLFGIEAAEIRFNHFRHATNRRPYAVAMYFNGCSSLQVYGNRITGRLPHVGVEWIAPRGSQAAPNQFYNNEIAGTAGIEAFSSAYNLVELSFLSAGGAQNLVMAHNTLRIFRPTGSQQISRLLAIWGQLRSTDSLSVTSNLLVEEGVSVPHASLVHQGDSLSGGLGFFNNVYWKMDTTRMFKRGGVLTGPYYTGLQQWQQLTGRDLGSRLVNPHWLQPDVLFQPTALAANNAGLLTGWPPTDITGQVRGSIPDAGAREFEPLPAELQLGALLVNEPGCVGGSGAQVRFAFQNLGLTALPSLPLSLWVNGVNQGSFRLPAIPAGVGDTLVFQQPVDLSFAAQYLLELRADTLADANAANDTVRLQLNFAGNRSFPIADDFEQRMAGSAPAFEVQRTIDNQLKWRVMRGENRNYPFGPPTDANGNAQGQYLGTAYFGPYAGLPPMDTLAFDYPCLNLASLAVPQLSFEVYSTTAFSPLRVLQRVNGIWESLDSVMTAPQQRSTDAWVLRRSFINPQADAIRFLTRSFQDPLLSSWFIDNIRIGELIDTDLVLDSLVIQTNSCSNSGTANAILYLRNDGISLINGIRGGIQLGNAAAVYRTAPRILAPFDTDTVHLAIPYNTLGGLPGKAFSANQSDVFFRGDTLAFVLAANGQQAVFPYFEAFEQASGWSIGGLPSSWELAAPAGLALLPQTPGNKAWVTTADGYTRETELSWMQSPCFDFTNLIRPQLTFALNYELGDGARFYVEYRSGNAGPWQVLGSTFSGTNWYNSPNARTGWTGKSNGWVTASHDLAFLAGQNTVQFRMVFHNLTDSTSLVRLFEGVAFDDFRIAESPGSFAFQTNMTPAEACSPVAHTIVTRIARANQLQQARVMYRVNGGAEVALPLGQVGLDYQAIIPAQPAGSLVSWRIETLSDTLLSTQPVFYTDGYLQQAPQADRTGPARMPVTLDNNMGQSGDLSIGQANTDSARGAWLEIEALRYTEIEALWVQPTAFTAIEVWGQVVNPGGDTLRQNQARLLASVRGVGPGGSNILFFSQRPALRPGQKLLLYVVTEGDKHLRVARANATAQQQDAQVVVRPGRLVQGKFGSQNAIGWPTARVITRNPASQIFWRNGNGVLLGQQNQLSTRIDTVPSQVIMHLVRGLCEYRDTIGFTPTGSMSLSVTQILQPDLTTVQQGVFYPIKVVVKNTGNLVIPDFRLAYQVNGLELAQSQVDRSLAVGDTMHYTFPQLWTWVEGNSITLCAYPAQFSLDVLRSDDTTCNYRFAASVAEGAFAGFKLYPVPASERVYMVLDADLQQPAAFSLYDAMGRRVLEQAFEAGESRFDIALSALPTGMYHYRLVSGSELQMGKLLVSK